MFTKYLASLCLLPIIIAAPASNGQLAVDTSSYCGKWDRVNAGQYTLLLDEWGSDATPKSVCASVTSLTSTSISWMHNFDWSFGNGGVKSFTNVQLNSGLNKQLSNIGQIPAAWKWKYKAHGTKKVIANVAYDLFMSSTWGGKTENEVMVWIGNFNAGPISTAYNADGTARPIATNIILANHPWHLFKGNNRVNDVFSFVLANNAHITNFNADLNVFFKYLTAHGYMSAAQFITTAQGGTEATSGSATFTTSTYSLAIN